jgi:uncharacterized repeat protein (TIGR01451 family)
MRYLIRLWPAVAGVLLAIVLLALLSLGPAQAVVQSIVHTTVADFNQGTFYRTGLSQEGDGEVALLTIGIAGQWVTTTNATGFVPRFEHAAIAARNRIYVFGGRTATQTLASIQYADSLANHNLSNWATAPVSLAGIYPAGISALSAATLNSYVYLIGGYSASEFSGITSTVSFARIQSDGSLTSFNKTAPLPQGLSRTDAVALNGRIYVVGGRGTPDSQGRKTVYYAQPNAATGQITQWFTATGVLPYPAFGHEAFTAGPYLYAASGISGTNTVIPNVYFAAPAAGTGDIAPAGWMATELMPFSLYEAASVSYGGQLYSTGGSASLVGTPSDFVGVALPNDDGTIDTWFNTALIFPARFSHAAVINEDGWIYVIGGTLGLNQPITRSIVNAGATTGPGGVYAPRGRYTGPIIDLTKDFELQNLKWTTYLGNTSSVSLTMRYRSRSSAGVWSDWSTPLPSLNVAGTATTTHLLTPTARYVQYEATFTSTNGLTTPILSRVELVYDTPEPPDLEKLASPPDGGSVQPRQRISYTLRYSNTENVVFHNVVISDRVPVSTTYVPGSIFAPPGVVAVDSGNPFLVWLVGDLQPYAGGEVGYAVTVDADVPEGAQILNIADLFSDEGDSQSPQVMHTVGTPPEVVKSAVTSAPSQAGATVQPGDVINYMLTVTNPSDLRSLTNVVITDQLPLHLNYVGPIGSPAPDTSLLASSRILRWNIGTIPPLEGRSVGFVAVVAATAPNGALLDNIAQVGSSEIARADSNLSRLTVKYRYDLALSKSDGRTTASAGGQVVYTLRITNTAAYPVTATGVIITDYIEPGLIGPGLPVPTATVLSFAGGTPGWSFVEVDVDGNAIYRYPVGSLGPNQTRVITMAVQIANPLPPGVMAIENYAETLDDGASGIELDYSNQGVADTDIVAGPELVVTGIRLLSQTELTVTVAVSVTNQGVDPTRGPDGTPPFGTDLYVKPAGQPAPFGPADRTLGLCPPPGPQCDYSVARWDLYYWWADGLAPGATAVLVYTHRLPAEGIYWLYAQADPFWGAEGDPSPIWGSSLHGRNVEFDEDNNIFGPLFVGTGGGQQVFLPVVLKNR